MICPNCKNNLPDNSQFCNRCGFNFIQYQQQQNNAYVQPNYNNQYQQPNYAQQPQPVNQQETPKKSVGCITYFGIAFFSLLTILLIAANVSTSLIIPFVVLDIALIIYSISNTPKNRSVILFIVFAILFVVGFILVINTYDDNTSDNTTTSRQTTETYTTEQKTEAETTEEITTEEVASVNIPLAKDFSRMKLGDICNDDDLYIGLSYAKLSPTLTINYANIQEDISDDKQVLFAFFDVYNAGDDVNSITSYNISCYVDGNAVSPVDTYYYYNEDGISNRFSDEIDANTCKILITDFEIPLEFSEIKLYYNSECAWTLKQNDVSTEPFEFNSMYDIEYEQGNTEIGEAIYSDKYEVIYDGYSYYTAPYSQDKYIIFKFTVNNTSSSTLDYSSVGYNMRCYVDNYALASGSYGIDDKIDDYINVYSYDIENIPSGMSAQVYVAFEVYQEYDSYRMIYNTGYIYDEILGEVFVNEQTATNTDAN